MNRSRGDPSAWLPELALQVEEACNRFEAAWLADAIPRIEAHLGDGPEPGLSVLLHELLALELEYRRRSGDVPTPEEYHPRFPGHTELVSKAFEDARKDDPQAAGPDAGGACRPCPTGPFDPADTGTGASEAGSARDEGSRFRAAAGKRARFTSLRKHAQGGLGTVSLAFDETLHRQVAVKEIRPELRGNAHLRRRFLTEAEITGQLEHPGVVPIYALEEDADGQPYYAMRFVQGGTLADAIQAYHARPTPLAFHALLKRFLDVCQMLAYAHSRGVVHRDLKPANVMLGNYGETLVVDWGLAKRVGSSAGVQDGEGAEPAPSAGDPGAGPADLTEAGQVLGTPAYMSPEQADGRAEGAGPATDVYALGAVLYELLTGQPPYRGAGLGAVLMQVRSGPPSVPAQVRRGVPRALEAVCLKAMARSSADRYASAGEMARDLERWLADEPVTAYREPLPTRLARWGRRHRTLVTAWVVVLLMFLSAVIIGGLVVGREQERARALAQADALPGAAPAAVPALLKDLEAHPGTVRPRLWARWQGPALTDSQRLRLGLALVDDAGVRTQLVALAGAADDPQEVLLVRDALAPYAAEVGPLLWGPVAGPATPPRKRLRLLAILAALDTNSDRWAAVAADVANALVRENVMHVSGWAEALRPVRGPLIPPLADVFRDATRPELERSLATGLLADYAADQPQVLADLLMDADEKQFAVLYARFKQQGEVGLPALTGEVERKLPPGAAGPDKERLAKRQANAAVALLRMNHPEKVWPVLKHGPDPRARSYLIHRFGPLGADAGAIVEQLKAGPGPSIRRALILSLGPDEFRKEAWTPQEKGRLVEQLQEMYTGPDPGLRAAAEWLLRQWKEEAWLVQADEAWAEDKGRRQKRLERILQNVTQAKENAKPQWYVNGQGQTMVVIPGPVEFVMGSPATEGGRREVEQQHWKRINRTFAIAAKPVTKAQFLRSRPTFSHNEMGRYPDPTCPIGGVDWYDAAAYCNWLSEREGIPKDQWCYETNSQGQVAKLREKYLCLAGYRLPTEAEMEYATRAGAVTSRCYGEAEALLPKYAWYAQNSGGRTRPVGSLKPNDFGLFDVHGNVYTWCQVRYKEYPQGVGKEVSEDNDDDININDHEGRISRGGSFSNGAPAVRSACRTWDTPTNLVIYIGLRPARTLR